MGSIYGVRNSLNGRWYIGKSLKDNPDRRINSHLSGNGNSIIKGELEENGNIFDSFVFESGIIDEELDFLEMVYITSYNSLAPNGYNLTEGGEGGRCSEETKDKIRESRKGKKHPKETKLKIGRKHKGKKLSKEHRLKIGASMKGKLAGENNPMYGKPSPNKGKNISEEHKRKISKANKGENSGMYGRKHTLEAKKRIGKASKGNTYRKGKPMSEEAKRKIGEASKRMWNERLSQ